MKAMNTILLIVAAVLLLGGCQDKPDRHFELGNWYYEKGLYDDAILEYRDVVRMMSSDPASMPREQLNTLAKAHYNLAVSYVQKEWLDEALREAETAFTLWPSDDNRELVVNLQEPQQ
ncbi:MAG: hypothetical protein QF923_00330 [Candidatus Marinimicrobia bacterium]|nr:hypothetical protein [Candidatus Neomarinimicrobiota bacterium]